MRQEISEENCLNCFNCKLPLKDFIVKGRFRWDVAKIKVRCTKNLWSLKGDKIKILARSLIRNDKNYTNLGRNCPFFDGKDV